MDIETQGQFVKRAIGEMATGSFNDVVIIFNEALLRFDMNHPIVLALVVNMSQRCLHAAPAMSTPEGAYRTLDAYKVYEAAAKLSE